MRGALIAPLDDDSSDDDDDTDMSACEKRAACFVQHTNALTDRLTRFLGPLFVAAALALIGGVLYVQFGLWLPRMASDVSVWSLFHWSASVYLTLQILSHYLRAVLTPPGSPAVVDLSPEEIEDLKTTPRSAVTRASWCRRCNNMKPPRAHHCSYCQRCVLCFDHHCPWIANCVGFDNYRSFVLFLAFLWIGCAYIVVLSSMILFGDAGASWGASERTAFIFSFVVTLAIFVSVGGLLGWHLYLSITAQTTVEFYALSSLRGSIPGFRSPWDHGWRKNLVSVFGPPGWLFINLWVPFRGKRQGDGVRYLVRDDSIF